jgi:hypothetical protein
VSGLSLVGYIDYARQMPKASLPLETAPAATSYKLDGFFEMVKNLVLGGEWYAYKNDLNQAGGVKYNVSGWSVFGRYALVQDKLNAFARYDSYIPNNQNRAKDLNLTIFGLDWAPLHSSMKLQPNIWIYSYKDGTQYKATATSNSDVAFNLTFFLSF